MKRDNGVVSEATAGQLVERVAAPGVVHGRKGSGCWQRRGRREMRNGKRRPSRIWE